MGVQCTLCISNGHWPIALTMAIHLNTWLYCLLVLAWCLQFFTNIISNWSIVNQPWRGILLWNVFDLIWFNLSWCTSWNAGLSSWISMHLREIQLSIWYASQSPEYHNPFNALSSSIPYIQNTKVPSSRKTGIMKAKSNNCFPSPGILTFYMRPFLSLFIPTRES